MRSKLSVAIAMLLCTGSLSAALADDAQIACNKLGRDAVRVQPSFSNNTSIQCDALPQSIPNIQKTCQAAVPKGTTANCTVNYFSEAPADTVVQCSADPAQGFPTVVFKYVLCENKNKNFPYLWAPLSVGGKATVANNQLGHEPKSILQKK